MFVLNELLAVLSPCPSLRQAQGAAQFSVSGLFFPKKKPRI